MRDTIYCVLCVLLTLALLGLCGRFVSHIWILTFIESLQTHFALACVLGALLALCVKRHWYAVLMLFGAVLLTGHAVLLLHAHSEEPSSAAQPSFRLLSFNIDGDNMANGARIADLILSSNADVAEIFEAAPMLPQLARLAALYPYQIGCGVLTKGCDSLLLSKRPFQKQSIRSMGELWRDRFILATIDMDGQPVAFASAHLSKPYFDEFHQDELDVLQHILKETKEPVLLAGDFNASVIEPDMQDLLTESGLKHVFPEPSTWPIKAGPLGIAIDHVFARPPIQLRSVTQIPDAMGSNHYGLISDFTIAR